MPNTLCRFMYTVVNVRPTRNRKDDIMASDDLDNLLQKINRVDAEDCGRLLSAYLNLPSSADRKQVIQFAETLVKPSDKFH